MSQIDNSDDIYYHYTSIPAFYNIISSKSLWLTSLKTSNDKEELYYKMSDFDNTLNYIVNNFPKELKENFYEKFNFLYQSYLNNKEKAELLNNDINTEPYGICFTSLKDSLAHWALYGDKMQGVCICFSYNEFLTFYGSLAFDNIIINSSKILYQPSELIELIINHAILFYDFFMGQHLKKFNEFIEKNGWVILINTLFFIKHFIKKEQFNVEKESRLFFDKQIMKRINLLLSSISDFDYSRQSDIFNYINNTIIDKLKINKINYNVFHNQIRAYQSISIESIWSSALIPQVILGPKCNQDRKELERFLIANGLTSTQITKSTIPLK